MAREGESLPAFLKRLRAEVDSFAAEQKELAGKLQEANNDRERTLAEMSAIQTAAKEQQSKVDDAKATVDEHKKAANAALSDELNKAFQVLAEPKSGEGPLMLVGKVFRPYFINVPSDFALQITASHAQKWSTSFSTARKAAFRS